MIQMLREQKMDLHVEVNCLNVQPIVLYGCETCILLTAEIDYLQALDVWH